MATPPPLVSVIMPCFDARAFVGEAVDCVLGQTYPRIELIAVDDGSTDDTLEVLRGYGGRIAVLTQANAGPYPARNLGLRHATGELVAFLDADDYWTPDFVEKLCRALDPRPDAALAYCGWQNVGLHGPRSDPYVPPDYEQGDKLEAFLRAASPWPIHAALVRKTVLDAVGGFDTEWRTCMDYDLWLRVAASRPIVRVPEVLAFYRHHEEGQITSTQWRQAQNVWRVKRKFVSSAPELVARVPAARLRELIDGGLLKRGYDAYWRRDLVSAQKIFRMAMRNGGWRLADLKYLLPALLPLGAYRSLVGSADRSGGAGGSRPAR
jgi:glycosyltransferase involved in cell wall biosynthesis